MGLPEEDKGPAWLRDYGQGSGLSTTDNMTGYNNGDIQVDLTGPGGLTAWADALDSEHQADYVPHANEVFEKMAEELPGIPAEFAELASCLGRHREIQEKTSTALVNHDRAVVAFVAAARELVQTYGGADALAAAKTSDVDTQLAEPPPSADPTVTPEEAGTQLPSAQNDGASDDGEQIP